ncbi:hypothetical protein GCM10009799_19290 [Nocardiopsis rhodophaea]|uniref:Uncharacterized protein n=1 Tax=Nocardiopsis rhodophaea TaxID=280238 RepID=A0ABN2SW93_9ACTN
MTIRAYQASGGPQSDFRAARMARPGVGEGRATPAAVAAAFAAPPGRCPAVRAAAATPPGRSPHATGATSPSALGAAFHPRTSKEPNADKAAQRAPGLSVS